MFLKSDSVTLRKTNKQDIDFVCSLEAMEENSKYIIP